MTKLAPGLHAKAGVEVDSSAYERWTGRWSRLFLPSVIAAAQIQPGNTVLDISTGTGEAAVAMLPVIGATGALVGADISPEMVRSAVKRVSDNRFLPIAADGQQLPFRNASFDALICQLGLQFFPNPALGLSEFRRVLRPGGKASVCVISDPDRAPVWGYLAKAIAQRLPDMRSTLMASFALADARQVEDLFIGAGFVNVSVRREVRGGIVNSLEAYWDPILTGVGSIPQTYLMLSQAAQREVREEVSARLAQFIAADGLHLSVEMLIADGQAAADENKATQNKSSLPPSIDPRLGKTLACPKTKEALEYDATTNELISRSAGLAFPIRDGIPIMLLDAARPLPGS